ncbi:PD40 domain-containing protein [Panacibacter sp. DH6]|uniref:PD40 domain-containing protein n=1 Tax=Panacibacter microcysteis TaxID=2793269 RepID=A0A931E0L0_9BACT|nr:OmpA family protein [Panacibacter microcysteis]MBG9374883.1 PD40 domain-containing protein [Panacibacter microcysteis]
MKTFLTAILAILSVAVFAQEPKIHPKAAKAYEDAMLQLRDGFIRDALPLLGKAIEYEPRFVDAWLSLAGVYGELKDYQKAIEHYKKAKAIDTAYFRFYNLPYSINLAGLGRFTDALGAVQDFLLIPNLNDKSIKSATYRKQCYEFAVDYQKKHAASTYIFTPENLGDSINSKQSEYYPSFTIDDSTLVFTRHVEGIRENFMMSNLLQNGYGKAAPINGQLNEQPSKGAINISQDGEWLVFAGNFGQEGFGNFDIYISYNTPQGWSTPVNLGANINTEFWESSPSLSPDKNALYFSSNRPGGSGGKDLYVSYRSANGRWQPAQNLGPAVNTKGDEIEPFIHADNRSLYFTSNGLQGYGGLDIFLSRKDAGNNWQIPENLGYPINTIEDEESIFVSSKGDVAYYASSRSDSRGGLDLYRFNLRADIKPVKTLYIQGSVVDAVTKHTIPCAVELIENSTQKVISKVQTDETGFYFVTLPVGNDYTFAVNRKGYLFYSSLFELGNKASDSIYVKDIQLQPLQVNAVGVLNNIQFETNTAKLQPVSLIELDKLLQLLQENTTLKVQINGHTDNTGTADRNNQLSLERAQAVVAFLTGKGIEAKRLTVKGFGASKPLADNATEEGRSMNRRTEFIVTGL